ncbi:hypothetical protein [Kribbella solani]|uniref:Uncharacterized protein n=1 Tax=Kribbella solani TaxID=236067 RepID=A0A841E4B1_9ACTN|nr:hypothetical protein [Kribbella solani]MBB5983780.1 hypothetical protein [Kribbella solani]
MSSIVPGPRKKLEEEITAARAGAKPLNASDLNPSAPQHEDLTGLDDWPDTLRTTVETEYARVEALATNRRKTADRTVPDLVRQLGALLDQIADAIQAARKSDPPEASLATVAELLGIPSDEQATGRSARRAAARTLKQLRGQLKDLETAPDHGRLTRLTTFTIRLALVLDRSPAAGGVLAPIALDRYANAIPDAQRDWPFDRKLTSWQDIHRTLDD